MLKKLRGFYSDRNLEILLRMKPRIGPNRHEYFFLTTLAFLVIALMRPEVMKRHEVQARNTGADIVILLDVSRSMDAQDVKPSRLEQAKAAITEFLKAIKGDRVGLMVFTSQTRMAVPLTKEYSQILAILPLLNTDTLGEQGSGLAAALSFGGENLKENAQNVLDPKLPSSFLVVVSDGEDTGVASVTEQAKALKKSGIVLQTITTGTVQGGPIPLRGALGEAQQFKKDSAGQTVITHADPASMRAIAEDGGGGSSAVTPDGVKILVEIKQKFLKSHDRAIFEQNYAELYFVPLNLALICLFLYFALQVYGAETKVRRDGVAVLLLFFFSFTAHAADTKAPFYSWLWTSDKQAVEEAKRLLDAGQATEGYQRIEETRSKDGDSETLRYDAATVLAQSKKRAEAEQLLRDSKKFGKSLQPFVRFNFAGLEESLRKKPEAIETLFDLVGDLSTRKELSAEEVELLGQARGNLELIIHGPDIDQKQIEATDKSDCVAGAPVTDCNVPGSKKKSSKQKNTSGALDATYGSSPGPGSSAIGAIGATPAVTITGGSQNGSENSSGTSTPTSASTSPSTSSLPSWMSSAANWLGVGTGNDGPSSPFKDESPGDPPTAGKGADGDSENGSSDTQGTNKNGGTDEASPPGSGSQSTGKGGGEPSNSAGTLGGKSPNSASNGASGDPQVATGSTGLTPSRGNSKVSGLGSSGEGAAAGAAGVAKTSGSTAILEPGGFPPGSKIDKHTDGGAPADSSSAVGKNLGNPQSNENNGHVPPLPENSSPRPLRNGEASSQNFPNKSENQGVTPDVGKNPAQGGTPGTSANAPTAPLTAAQSAAALSSLTPDKKLSKEEADKLLDSIPTEAKTEKGSDNGYNGKETPGAKHPTGGGGGLEKPLPVQDW